MTLYYFFHVLGFVGSIVYILFYSRKFQIPLKKSVPFVILSYVTLYAMMLVLHCLITGTFGGKNMVRNFVFLPLIVFYFAKALNINVSKAMDFSAPIQVIVFGISRIGCLFEHCCYSNIETSFGFYNPVVGKTLFPNQILEIVVAFGIVIFLLILFSKKKFELGGVAMPIMLVLFGFTRFLLEFIRDNEKLFWGISELAIWAFAAGVLGSIWLLILNYKRRKV